MNRKGAGGTEHQLMQVGLLIVAAIMLLVIYAVSTALFGDFGAAEKDWRANRNLELLGQRIDAAMKSGTGDSSVILEMPRNRFLVGFDANATEMILTVDSAPWQLSQWATSFDYNVHIPRPDACDSGKVCICSARLDSKADSVSLGVAQVTFIAVPLHCNSFDLQTVVGSQRATGIHLNWIVSGTNSWSKKFLFVPDPTFVVPVKTGRSEQFRDFLYGGTSTPVNMPIHIANGELVLTSYGGVCPENSLGECAGKQYLYTINNAGELQYGVNGCYLDLQSNRCDVKSG